MDRYEQKLLEGIYRNTLELYTSEENSVDALRCLEKFTVRNAIIAPKSYEEKQNRCKEREHIMDSYSSIWADARKIKKELKIDALKIKFYRAKGKKTTMERECTCAIIDNLFALRGMYMDRLNKTDLEFSDKELLSVSDVLMDCRKKAEYLEEAVDDRLMELLFRINRVKVVSTRNLKEIELLIAKTNEILELLGTEVSA